MSKPPNVQPLRIADSKRAIRHVFIRNLELHAQIGIYPMSAARSSRCASMSISRSRTR